jgi:hypothetical protein
MGKIQKRTMENNEWDVDLPITMDEYMHLKVEVASEEESIWKRSHKGQMSILNALIKKGPIMEGKTDPKVYRFLLKSLKDFLE